MAAERGRESRGSLGWLVVVTFALVAAVAAGGWLFLNANLTTSTIPPPDLAAVQRALGQGRWDEVEARLARWNAAHPEDGEPAIFLGLARINAGRVADGIAVLEMVPKDSPAWGQAHALIAEGELLRKNAAEAERRLRLAIERDPKAVPPRQRLIYLLSIEQRNAEAHAELWALFRQTRDPRSLVELVERRWAREDDVRGQSPELEAFLKATPEDPFLRRAWGLTRLYQGKLAEALPDLEAAAASIEDDPIGRFALAETRLALGRTVAEKEPLGPCPKSPADAARWQVLSGRLADALGNTEAALEHYRAAVTASPDDREGRFRLAQLLRRLGRLEDARAEDARVAAIDAARQAVRQAFDAVRREGFGGGPGAPASPETLERLGQLCRQAGLVEEARAWFDLALAGDPNRASTRHALAALGTAVPSEPAFPRRASRAAIASKEAPGSASSAEITSIRFNDITSKAEVSYRYDSGAGAGLFLADTIGGGVGLFDADNDGFLDILFVNGCTLPVDPDRPPSPNRYYRNRGDGTFVDETVRSGLGGRGFGMGCAAGDYDADGDLDVVVTGVHATLLFRNKGNGTFEDVSESAGIRSDRWTTAAAFADLDADGDLDLVVAGYVAEDFRKPRDCRDGAGRRIHCSPRSYASVPDHLFRNNGDGTFTDVAKEAGFDAPEGRGLGLAVADFDDDGKIDIYVANDATDDFLFRNLGGLKFEEVAHAAGLATDGEGKATASMGTVAADLDGDGRIDLLHTNLLNESTTLHRNMGGGLFRDATLEAGLRAPSRSRTGFGVAAIDADHDGRPDLFVANGHVDDQPWLNSPMAQTAQFFEGRDGGRFLLGGPEISPYLSRPVVGRGLAAGDLDNDGRVDVVVVHRDTDAVVLRNETEVSRKHWLGLKFPADAAGARVTCRSGGRTITGHVTSGTGYLGPNDSRLVLGLGEDSGPLRIEIRWPSGLAEAWGDAAPDRYLVVRPGAPPRP